MKEEYLKIFDENQVHIGEKTRDEVHKKGYWHETFHCWFVSEYEGEIYLYFQIRSKEKKDYPNLLDITAAGHLLAHETVMDGIREVEEELGVEVAFNNLLSLGVIPYSVTLPHFIDKELAHVFVYKTQHTFEGYTLQQEEVSGLVRAKLSSVVELWLGQTDSIDVEGFQIHQKGEKTPINKAFYWEEFVQHKPFYYERIIHELHKTFHF
ncbi:NUDIX hydrolase [Priestia filamentosa]|uniref:NUDIX hydrolase n=1 Tax=Priestia filamentosa TaxID=1402861 RepID=UPI0002F347CB|nr:hypothetical protein [Priestia filamentosa]